MKLKLGDGSECIRSYTPVSSDLGSDECPHVEDDQSRTLHFLIKIYPEGPFTSQLDRLIQGLKNDRKVSLLFCNRTSNDVIWNNELLRLSNRYADKLVIWYVLSEPEEEWTGFRGRIS